MIHAYKSVNLTGTSFSLCGVIRATWLACCYMPLIYIADQVSWGKIVQFMDFKAHQGGIINETTLKTRLAKHAVTQIEYQSITQMCLCSEWKPFNVCIRQRAVWGEGNCFRPTHKYLNIHSLRTTFSENTVFINKINLLRKHRSKKKKLVESFVLLLTSKTLTTNQKKFSVCPCVRNRAVWFLIHALIILLSFWFSIM